MYQNRNRLGLRPRPHWGAHDALPAPLVEWGGGHPLPIPHSFGASTLAPSVLEAPRSLRLRRSICVQLKMFLVLSPAVTTLYTSYGTQVSSVNCADT